MKQRVEVDGGLLLVLARGRDHGGHGRTDVAHGEAVHVTQNLDNYITILRNIEEVEE